LIEPSTVENAGVEGSIVVGKLLEKTGNWGFNAQAEEYVDMVTTGIIDPTKVARVALQDAASAASLLIITEAMIAENPKDKSPRCPAAAWISKSRLLTAEMQNPGGDTRVFC
jgi:chaperonin GroEL